MIGRISILGNDILCERDSTGANTTVRIPLDDETVTQLQQWTQRYRSAVRDNDPLPLADVGRALFTWLDVNNWATEWAKGTGRRELEIAVDESESAAAAALLDLPWELLADAQGFLVGDPAQPFVIYRSISRARDATPQKPAHRDLAVMFMAASPAGEQELDYEAEEAAILQATEGLPLQLVVEESGNPGFLKERLAADGPFEAIHLSCHGTILPSGEPVLALETPEGDIELTLPATFANVLGEQKAPLVFLSACRTAEAGMARQNELTEPYVRTLIRAGVPNVLGWDGSVYDPDAINFAQTFYGGVNPKRGYGKE